MAKNSQTNGRSTAIDVGGDDALGVMAAWQGLYHAFGARFESVDVTPDGLVIYGLSTTDQYDPDKIVSDLNTSNRRVPLFPTIFYIQGGEPAPFNTAQEMTAWTVQNFRGSVEKDSTRTPKYVRDAFNDIKRELGIGGKRGPKPKTINLKNLQTLDASVLRNAGVSKDDLAALVAVAQSVIDEASAAEATTA